MSALPLLDMYLSLAKQPVHDSGSSPDQLRQVAERLVDAALSERRHLEQLGTCVSADEPAEVGARAASILRGMYEQWSRETEAILQRLDVIERGGVPVEAADELRHQHGRVGAMLSITAEDIEKGRQQFRDGRWRTVEEVRRELGLRA